VVDGGTCTPSIVAIALPPIDAVGAGRGGWVTVGVLIKLILFSEEGKIIPRIPPAAIATEEGVESSKGGDGRWGTEKGAGGGEAEARGKVARMAGSAAKIAAPSARTWSPTSRDMSG